MRRTIEERIAHEQALLDEWLKRLNLASLRVRHYSARLRILRRTQAERAARLHTSARGIRIR